MTGRRLAIALAIFGSVFARAAAAEEFTKDDMDAVCKQLDDAAEAWIKGQDVPIGIDARLKAIECNDKTVPLFTAALGMARKDPANLYAANKLVLPFLMAKSEPIAKIVPAVTKIYGAAGGYQQFPTYTPDQLKDYQMPSPPPASQAAANIRKRQDAKMAAERHIALHNQQLYRLELSLGRLMLYANTKECDQQLIDLIHDTEEKGVYTWVDLVSSVREEAEKMGKDRAKVFYDALVKMGSELRLKKKTYLKPAEFTLSPNGNSTLATSVEYCGIRLFEAANVIATTAKTPAFIVPTKQEVDKGSGPRPTRPPRGPRGTGAPPPAGG
ncbi:MAG: hypothetical protein ACE15C_04260 [Phycisphaerae bacterium]